MAQKLARILKTDIMADLPLASLAQVIQKAGRGRDTVLAHITPKEAKLLKDRGGRGSRNPETGLLEFEDEGLSGDYFGPLPATEGASYAPQVPYVEPGSVAQTPTVQQETGAVPQYDVGGGLTAAPFQFQYTGPTGPVETGVPAQQFGGYQTGAYQPALPSTFPTISPEYQVPVMMAPQAEQQPGFLEKLKTGLSKRLSDPFALGALGLGGFGLLQNVARSNAARRQAAAARQEQEQLAAPYRQAAQQDIGAAQRGELTAQGQQAFQIAQARAAQGAARYGGVGQQQATMDLERYRQQLISSQYERGLQLAGIADKIVTGAIRTGLEADREAQNANANFFNTLMTAMGSATRA